MSSQLFRAPSASQEAAATSTRIVVVTFPTGSAITQVVWTFQEDPAVVIPAISLPVRHRDLNDQRLDTRINRSHFASACSSFLYAACEVKLKCLRRPNRASLLLVISNKAIPVRSYFHSLAHKCHIPLQALSSCTTTAILTEHDPRSLDYCTTLPPEKISRLRFSEIVVVFHVPYLSTQL